MSNMKVKRERERKKRMRLGVLCGDCWQQNAKLRQSFAEIVKILNGMIYER